jgi:hypothetical protein
MVSFAAVGTISTGSAFVNGNVGYLPIAANGVGTTILTTGDGGKTWTNNVTSEPTALLLLDIAAHRDVSGKDNVAVIGTLSLEYSRDSAVTFNKSIAPLGVGQCIRNIADTPGAFAAVGTWGLIKGTNGPALSFDGGLTYKAQNIVSLTTEVRYGAFPTSQTWFITAGQCKCALAASSVSVLGYSVSTSLLCDMTLQGPARTPRRPEAPRRPPSRLTNTRRSTLRTTSPRLLRVRSLSRSRCATVRYRVL